MKLAPIIATAVMAALSSCGPAYVSQIPHSAPTPRETALAGDICQTVDAYRRSKGGTQLKRHPGLDELAREHSAFLRANRSQFDQNSSEVGRYGSEQRSVTAKVHYHINESSENVAAANGSASSIVKLWENSPSHDANLRNKWTVTGIGVVIDDDGRAFVTQMFGSQTTGFPSQDLDRFKQH